MIQLIRPIRLMIQLIRLIHPNSQLDPPDPKPVPRLLHFIAAKRQPVRNWLSCFSGITFDVFSP
ncbi:MAG: hypothetical protein GX945_03365 [Lentisphaerae bacterium]|jgi:hypothetical protein|nr:hypothetical protein [Lentisphaerota bacterium]